MTITDFAALKNYETSLNIRLMLVTVAFVIKTTFMFVFTVVPHDSSVLHRFYVLLFNCEITKSCT